MGTGAASLYKLSRSQKFVMAQEFFCMQMSESGFSDHNEFVLDAGAKTVTNNLPLLSVLAERYYLVFSALIILSILFF